jgi:hypothetical protein
MAPKRESPKIAGKPLKLKIEHPAHRFDVVIRCVI